MARDLVLRPQQHDLRLSDVSPRAPLRNAWESRFKASRQDLVTTCIFYLSNRRPDRWRRNGQFDVQITESVEKRAMTLEEVVRTYSDAYGATSHRIEEQITAHVAEERTDTNVGGIFAEAICTTLEK